VTGDVCWNEAAARHALQAFPERWHRAVDEALRIRHADLAGTPVAGALAAQLTDHARLRGRGGGRPLYRTPLARRRDVLAFAGMAIADAHRVYRELPLRSERST
jgi:hypothetical protein